MGRMHDSIIASVGFLHLHYGMDVYGALAKTWWETQNGLRVRKINF
jgi:hypothetical protein